MLSNGEWFGFALLCNAFIEMEAGLQSRKAGLKPRLQMTNHQ